MAQAPETGGAPPPAGDAEVNQPLAAAAPGEALASAPISTATPYAQTGMSGANGATAVNGAHQADAEPEPVSARQRTRPPRRSHGPAHAEGAEGGQTPTSKRKRVTRTTDSAGRMPALRLNRVVGRARAERRPAVVYDTTHAPGYLRLVRLLVGLASLALAWIAALLVVTLAEMLWAGFPHHPALTERFALFALGAIAIAWLGLVALALIVVGALALMLALTRRGW